MDRRLLNKLDDRIIHLAQLEGQRELGRLEGENRGMEMLRYYRGECDKPEEFKRTEHKRLQKHLEREYKRVARNT